MSDYGEKTLGDIIVVLHTKLIDIPLHHNDYIFMIEKNNRSMSLQIVSAEMSGNVIGISVWQYPKMRLP